MRRGCSGWRVQGARTRTPSVIRNYVFRNSKEAAVVIRNAKNVLLQANTFQDLRTRVAGNGVGAINIACPLGCAIENITIRNNTFKAIGGGRDPVRAEHAEHPAGAHPEQRGCGGADVRENALDVKG